MIHRLMTALKFVTVSVLGYFFMLLVQHYWIYKYLIVSRLPTVATIPFHWYLGWILPTIVIILVVGYWSKNICELTLVTFFLGVVNSLQIYSLYMFEEPGYIKYFEGPPIYNIYELILVRFVIITIPTIIVYVSKKFIEHFLVEIEDTVGLPS